MNSFPSSSWSYFATDGQSVSLSWCRSPNRSKWPDFCLFVLLLKKYALGNGKLAALYLRNKSENVTALLRRMCKKCLNFSLLDMETIARVCTMTSERSFDLSWCVKPRQNGHHHEPISGASSGAAVGVVHLSCSNKAPTKFSTRWALLSQF
jgi:hypothetical protein